MIYIYGFDPELHKCYSCEFAKDFCKEKNLEYKFISVIKLDDGNITHDKEVVQELEEKYGDSVSGISLPQIFYNDTYIGGTAMLKQFYEQGKLNG